MGAFIAAIVASKLKSTKAVILLDGAAKASDHQRGIVQPSLGRLSREYTSKEHYVDEIQKIYTNLGVHWNDVLQSTVEYEVGPVGDHWENKSAESRIVADFDSFFTFDPKIFVQDRMSCLSCLCRSEYWSDAAIVLFNRL